MPRVSCTTAEEQINEIKEFIEDLNPFRKFKLISKYAFPLLCENINNKIYYELINTPIIINKNILCKYYNIIYQYYNSLKYTKYNNNELRKMYIYYVCNISKKVPYGKCYKSLLKILHTIFRPLKYEFNEAYIEDIEKFKYSTQCVILPSIVDKEIFEIFKNIFIKENLKW